MTLKYVSEETGALHPLPLTPLSAVQRVYDLKGRSLVGEAKGLCFTTSSSVNMANLQHGTIAWELGERLSLSWSLLAGFTFPISLFDLAVIWSWHHWLRRNSD